MTKLRIAISAALLQTLAGCSDPPKPPPPPADTAVADTQPTVAPHAAPNKIGLMPLLTPLSGEGDCLSRAEATRTAALQGGFPPRTIGVETGAGARDFVPMTLRVEMTQLGGTQNEVKESIYVLFNASGVIERGRRDYTVTNDPKMNQQSVLLAEDSVAAKQLAQAVYEKCK